MPINRSLTLDPVFVLLFTAVKNCTWSVGFEVSTAVTMKNAVFWN
jgi:hypothetical protein